MTEKASPQSVLKLAFGGLSHHVIEALERIGVLQELKTPVTAEYLVAQCEIKNADLLHHCLLNLVGVGAVMQTDDAYVLSGGFGEIRTRMAAAALALPHIERLRKAGVWNKMVDTGVSIPELSLPGNAYLLMLATGVVYEESNAVRLTENGIFMTDSPPSLSGLFRYFATIRVDTWRRIDDFLMGMAIPAWPYNPEQWKVATAAIAQVTAGSGKALPGAIKMKSGDTLTDLGAGAGIIASSIKDAYPDSEIAIMDDASVLSSVTDDRLQQFPGNILSDNIPNSKHYLLSNTLHVLSDIQVVHLLRRIKGRLHIVDFLVGENPFAAITSLEFVLTAGTGGNRTLQQFKTLLSEAGWTLESSDQLAGAAYYMCAHKS